MLTLEPVWVGVWAVGWAPAVMGMGGREVVHDECLGNTSNRGDAGLKGQAAPSLAPPSPGPGAPHAQAQPWPGPLRLLVWHSGEAGSRVLAGAL